MDVYLFVVVVHSLRISIKWSLLSHRSKMGVIYTQSWKQCALPFITTMAFLALWQLMHLCTWCTVINLSAQVHELPQSHCVDNREGTLFSWLHIHIYIHTYIYIYIKPSSQPLKFVQMLNRLSYQAVNSTCTQSQLCRAIPISSLCSVFTLYFGHCLCELSHLYLFLLE